jgi:hypothetical protein
MIARRVGWLLPVVALLTMGMGDMGLTGGDDIPPWPSRNFAGTVTDRTLVVLHVDHINCEGHTAIKAYLGEMEIQVPFETIAAIEFSPGTAEAVWGQVELRNGKTDKMRFRGNTRCYAKSELGSLKVKIQNLKSIKFDSPPPP